MENILEVKNLTKNFGKFRALDGISFTVPRGKIIGLLGPNGAGKTTSIHILLGLTTADGGGINYFGKNFFQFRRESLQRINFTSSFNTLQGRISVWENLLVFAELYSVQNSKKKISEFIDYFGIQDLLNIRFWDLSAGQKTRVNIIKSLLNDPELILMDEPTASLDPDIADKTLSLIESLNKNRGLSLLYTSHDMEEVTRICDEVIFLDHGKIVAQDTPLGLTKRIPKARLFITFEGAKEKFEPVLIKRAQSFEFVNTGQVTIETTEKLLPELLFSIAQTGVTITDIEIKKPDLEDVFLSIARGGRHEI